MIIFYVIFAFIVLFIFNTMTYNFCQRMELNELRAKKAYKVINMIIVTMLVCSYLRILNVAV